MPLQITGNTVAFVTAEEKSKTNLEARCQRVWKCFRYYILRCVQMPWDYHLERGENQAMNALIDVVVKYERTQIPEKDLFLSYVGILLKYGDFDKTQEEEILGCCKRIYE
jgi:hypothetical protein